MIVAVEEIWAGRVGGKKPNGEIEYVRAFRVQTNNAYDAAGTILASPLIPAYGEVYSEQNGFVDENAFCLDRGAQQSPEDPTEWTATCRYNTISSDQQLEPLSRSTRYEWATEWIEKAVAKDLDGNKIVNSAMETFETPAVQAVPVLVITASKNYAVFDEDLDYFPYIDRVNSEEFWGYDPGQVYLDDIRSSTQQEAGIQFYPRTYRFKIRTDEANPWNWKPLDQGFMNWDPGNEVQYTAYTRDGQPPARPVLLDGGGQTLAIWATPTPEPFYHNFRLKGSANFNDFELDD